VTLSIPTEAITEILTTMYIVDVDCFQDVILLFVPFQLLSHLCFIKNHVFANKCVYGGIERMCLVATCVINDFLRVRMVIKSLSIPQG